MLGGLLEQGGRLARDFLEQITRLEILEALVRAQQDEIDVRAVVELAAAEFPHPEHAEVVEQVRSLVELCGFLEGDPRHTDGEVRDPSGGLAHAAFIGDLHRIKRQ